MEQQQSQYENTDSVRVGDLEIQQRIKNALPLVIRILAYVQVVLSILIFGMEIGIIVCYVLAGSDDIFGVYAGDLVGPLTAAGIWTSIVMDIAIVFLFILQKQISEQRMWLINAITQGILFIFTIILIGITGDYINKHRTILVCNSVLTGSDESFKYPCIKYQLHQAQLVFAILMFFSALLFIGLFLYLYFVVRIFPSTVLIKMNPSNNNNNNPGLQQQRSGWSAPPPQLPSTNATSVVQTSG